VIQLNHVAKAYPGDPPALHDVNLTVDRGEFVFLTGPSGAGKSTLLRMLFGAEKATSGEVLVDGKNIAALHRKEIALLRRRIGVVFQDFKLLPRRTVFDNVSLAQEVLGTDPREVRRKTNQLLRYVGLSEKGNVLPARLSGGEQQRVAIARALSGDPALLIADEPTGNLDQERAADIMDLLASVNARGTTVIIATHDRQMLSRFTNRRILVLDRGGIITDGILDGVPDFTSIAPAIRPAEATDKAPEDSGN
jgi:cell division transport system ATP-binding protein